ncbi:alpha/beta hydrolase family domain-containing protein [Purpureocillium lavendulum]|uniref:Alpha/beta hydrolase family domain-containing protein n=1 Tax=Purpureocillium lavendulum TaxID=1247861 RepID=A0AB34FGV1_9HYPO|nr:alpha/beta hydrolase family domain-containing protein [Purpureocillium lavendulum]
MAKKPTIVLVYGFWGNAAHWGDVIVDLDRRGYNLQAVELPLTSLADDAERTRKMVRQAAGDVLLVGHSYGGAVITEMGGDLPNVVGLVYIAAFAPDEGESLASMSEQYPAAAVADGALVPDSDGFLWIRPERFRETFCQDATPEQGLVMAVTQKAPVASTFADRVTTAAWRVKPSWYQVSTEDRCVSPEAERFMAARMKPRRTVELATGHASLASRPVEIAELIHQAATDTNGTK